MPTRIKVTTDGKVLEGELNDSETAAALLKRFPLKVRMSRWGEEYYGDIGPKLGVSQAPDAGVNMSVGELAFWIPGNALCIFFGPTPASDGPEPRAASDVNPVGRITSDTEVLKPLGHSVTAVVEVAD